MGAIEKTVDAVAQRVGPACQLIVICGSNKKLMARLKAKCASRCCRSSPSCYTSCHCVLVQWGCPEQAAVPHSCMHACVFLCCTALYAVLACQTLPAASLLLCPSTSPVKPAQCVTKQLRRLRCCRTLPEGMHVSVQGFVDNMEEWMAACDIIITKAGPGTIAESLIMGLPILLNGFVPCQESGNVPFVIDNKVRALAGIYRWLKASHHSFDGMSCYLSCPTACVLGATVCACLCCVVWCHACKALTKPQQIRSCCAAALNSLRDMLTSYHCLQVGAYEKDPDDLARVLQHWMADKDGEFAALKQRAAKLGQQFAGGLFRIVHDLADLADQAGTQAAPAFRKYIPPGAMVGSTQQRLAIGA